MREVAPGVWLVPRAVRISAVLRRLTRAPLSHAACIFNPDTLRAQASIGYQKRAHPEAVDALERTRARIERALTEHFALDTPARLASGVVIRSVPGCAVQPAHTDLDAFDPGLRARGNGFVAGGVVLALQRATRLWVWTPADGGDFFGEEPLRVETITVVPRAITIPPGSALYFRGDVVHAGAAYERYNTRVHWYVDTDESARKPNSRYDDELRAWASKRGVTFSPVDACAAAQP